MVISSILRTTSPLPLNSKCKCLWWPRDLIYLHTKDDRLPLTMSSPHWMSYKYRLHHHSFSDMFLWMQHRTSKHFSSKPFLVSNWRSRNIQYLWEHPLPSPTLRRHHRHHHAKHDCVSVETETRALHTDNMCSCATWCPNGSPWQHITSTLRTKRTLSADFVDAL